MKESKVNITLVVMFIIGIVIGIIGYKENMPKQATYEQIYGQTEIMDDVILPILNIIESGFMSVFVYGFFLMVSVRGNRAMQLFSFIGFIVIGATSLLKCGDTYEIKYLLTYFQYGIAYILANSKKIKKKEKEAQKEAE